MLARRAIVSASLSLLSLVQAACGGGAAAPPDARLPPDLSNVEPTFAPSAVSVGEALGVSYQIPIGDSAADTTIRNFTISQLQAAGIRWDRRDVLWRIVEPSRGQLDFSGYDRVIDAALAAGVHTIPILLYGTSWATAAAGPGEHNFPPDDPADFANYARATVARYKDRISTWEIWNEANVGLTFWRPREDAGAYAALLETASAAIRAEQPEATVVLGGLLYHQQVNAGAETFLEDMYFYNPNIGAAFDVLAYHPYKLYPPKVAPEVDDPSTGELGIRRTVARMRAIMTYYGDDPAKPIWVTELGYPVYENTLNNVTSRVTEEQQARWSIRAVLLLMASGVDRVFWFTMIDGADFDAFPPEGAFGLWRYDDPSGAYDPQPKRAWLALVYLLSVAREHVVAADLAPTLTGAPVDTHAYRLARADGTGTRITIAWRADDNAAPATVTFPVDAARALTVTDMLGNPLPASPDVALSGDPVYLIEQ